jgi:hypothetical protein
MLTGILVGISFVVSILALSVASVARSRSDAVKKAIAELLVSFSRHQENGQSIQRIARTLDKDLDRIVAQSVDQAIRDKLN